MVILGSLIQQALSVDSRRVIKPIHSGQVLLFAIGCCADGSFWVWRLSSPFFKVAT